jgi:Tol biopolymer transport system component
MLSLDLEGGEGDRYSWAPSITEDGRFVAFHSLASNLYPSQFSGDRNGVNVFLMDLQGPGGLSVLSVDEFGNNGLDVNFSREVIERVFSSDGRFYVFSSGRDGMLVGDGNGYEDVFIKDLDSGELRILSVSSSGSASNDRSFQPTISRDGRYIFFVSDASNLVPGDENERSDVFSVPNPFLQ